MRYRKLTGFVSLTLCIGLVSCGDNNRSTNGDSNRSAEDRTATQRISGKLIEKIERIQPHALILVDAEGNLVLTDIAGSDSKLCFESKDQEHPKDIGIQCRGPANGIEPVREVASLIKYYKFKNPCIRCITESDIANVAEQVCWIPGCDD